MIPVDILQSNRDLTPGERHHIKQLARDTDVELKVLREAFAQLKHEAKELLKIAHICQLALAPIRNLPNDVLGKIFLACVRGEEPSMSRNKAPLILTRICSSFRKIALSTPALWTRIALRIPEDEDEYDCEERISEDEDEYDCEERIPEDEDEDDCEEHQVPSILRSRVNSVSKWILRSGTLPLSIEITSGIEFDMLERFQEEQYALVEALLKSATRWRHLSLRFDGCSPLFVEIMELTPEEVPSLTSLNICNDGDEESLPCDIFQASQLTELTLMGSLDMSEYDINWPQLTRLNLNVSVQEIAPEILQQTQKLVHLSLDDVRTDDNIGDIYLPYLRELTVRRTVGIPRPGVPLVASYIYAPALETLHAEVSASLLTNIVERSPHIQNLEIRIGYYDAVAAWLENCPQITSLVIHVDETQNPTGHLTGLLEELVQDRDGTYTCPNLRVFHYDGVLAVSYDILSQFLGAKNVGSILVPREWETVDIKVVITDWDPSSKKVMILAEVVHKWECAGVLKLKIIHSGRPQ